MRFSWKKNKQQNINSYYNLWPTYFKLILSLYKFLCIHICIPHDGTYWYILQRDGKRFVNTFPRERSIFSACIELLFIWTTFVYYKYPFVYLNYYHDVFLTCKILIVLPSFLINRKTCTPKGSHVWPQWRHVYKLDTKRSTRCRAIIPTLY